ncbi:hypothetical protein AMK31_28375 [Streptomyces sp. TSRI0107]|nr:hypothetical protein AMK31_28375 [Streptomyces sp. TSRI0107]
MSTRTLKVRTQPDEGARAFGPACDTNHTRVAELREKWPPARETHRGPHARLCEATAIPRR